MDRLKHYGNILEKILREHAEIPYRYGDVKTSLIVSEDRTQFLLIDEGWERGQRVHGCLVHAQIKTGKIWIHYDGIEDSITVELVEAGIPKDQIVLAFHPLEIRQHTGYAVS
ncbi:MAG: XisI protein [Leptolyngbyaceae cyanobacterium]